MKIIIILVIIAIITIFITCQYISQKLYYKFPLDSDNYELCATSLPNCVKCNTKTECIECETNYDIEESDQCIPHSDVVAKLYYKDTTNNKYISCSKIFN